MAPESAPLPPRCELTIKRWLLPVLLTQNSATSPCSVHCKKPSTEQLFDEDGVEDIVAHLDGQVVLLLKYLLFVDRRPTPAKLASGFLLNHD